MSNLNKVEIFIGIAVEDKQYDSDIVKAYIIELSPYMLGELFDYKKKELKDILNKNNVKEKIEINTSNWVLCNHLKIPTNRVHPPDIRKGEQVLVFHYYDTDIYYWISLGRDDRLRRNEIYRLAISDDVEIDKKLSEDNTYFIEMDTLHSKRIRIKTSKSDNEDFQYLIVIDALNNYAGISDDDGNEIILESDIPRIRLKNKKESFIDINNTDIFLSCSRDIAMHAGRQFVLKTPTETRIVDNVSYLKTNKFTVEANLVSMFAPSIGLEGSVKVQNVIYSPFMVAGHYNTGSGGSMYVHGTTDVEKGISKNNAPVTPETNTGSGPRHCTAWEQNHQNMTLIVSTFAEVSARLTDCLCDGLSSPYPNIIPTSAKSIMLDNMGE